MAKVYRCAGSCHGVATVEQWEKGATTCGAKICERHGQPLQPVEQCAECSLKALDSGKASTCPQCRLIDLAE